MNPHWHAVEDNLQFAIATDYRTGIDLRMVVEKLPRADGRDWIVWLPGRQKVLRKRTVLSLRMATALVEKAADGLARSGTTGGSAGETVSLYPGIPPISDDFQIAFERARETIGKGIWEQSSLTERTNAIYAELRAMDAERMGQAEPTPKV